VHRFFRYCVENQRDTQTNGGRNPSPRLSSARVIIRILWLCASFLWFTFVQRNPHQSVLKSLGQAHIKQETIGLLSQILSRIEYALPVWSDYLNAEKLTGKINSFFRRCFRHAYCFCDVVFKAEQLLEKSDNKMSIAIQNPDQWIHSLLPPIKDTDMSLRPRCHNYQLPVVTRKQHHQSFVPRCLFN